MANSDSEKVASSKKYQGENISTISKNGGKLEFIGVSGEREIYKCSVGDDIILLLVDPTHTHNLSLLSCRR